MAYTEDDWKLRARTRVDLCTQVTHLTRSATIDGRKLSALDVLVKILSEETIKGSDTKSGFIVGNQSAVCFQETPLYSICQNIDLEREIKKKTDASYPRYEPYGLMFPKPYVYRRGGRPAIYDKKELAKQYLCRTEWWRIVSLDLSDPNRMIDWTHEREWRHAGDFTFDIEQATVIVPNAKDFREFLSKDVGSKVRSVVNLSTSYV